MRKDSRRRTLFDGVSIYEDQLEDKVEIDLRYQGKTGLKVKSNLYSPSRLMRLQELLKTDADGILLTANHPGGCGTDISI